jgi:Na+/proline symporter
MENTIRLKNIWWAAPVAGLAAALANAVLFFIFEAMGAIPPDIIVPNAGQPITVVPVMMASFMPAIFAGILLALLAAFTAKPVKIFLVITTVVLILSFYTPFTIPEAIMPMILALNLMHIVAAVVIAWLLIRLSRR